eukprot:scaffold256609_cov27-Tisochrysis_lutea.AAC.4
MQGCTHWTHWKIVLEEALTAIQSEGLEIRATYARGSPAVKEGRYSSPRNACKHLIWRLHVRVILTARAAQHGYSISQDQGRGGGACGEVHVHIGDAKVEGVWVGKMLVNRGMRTFLAAKASAKIPCPGLPLSSLCAQQRRGLDLVCAHIYWCVETASGLISRGLERCENR